jgi:predicted Rossmann fold flavoprotein
MQTHRIIIVGGGAAGFFAAINAADLAHTSRKPIDIQILEASDSVLKKVRISGGGRCNVTHHQFDVRKFCENYPRGSKELISAMSRFQARDTVEWFAKRGVTIVPEEDGRMFPDTNSSETIIDCFLNTARELGIKIQMNHSVTSIAKSNAPNAKNNQFIVNLKDKEPLIANSVMIATGSSQHGYKLAKELGHTITELAPSLFSFKITDDLLTDLLGLSFQNANVKLLIPGIKPFEENGPLLITHWGLSGPAVLKISAWAAREMMHAGYRAKLQVNWMGHRKFEDIVTLIKKLKEQNLRAHVTNIYPEVLAKRFWLKLLIKCQIPEERKWADLSNKEIQIISNQLYCTEFDVLGKNRFKDEFVECGGIELKEINFKTMESKLCPGLFFAGEVLDIDGITGGFNFQNAWTGGWIAAHNL